MGSKGRTWRALSPKERADIEDLAISMFGEGYRFRDVAEAVSERTSSSTVHRIVSALTDNGRLPTYANKRTKRRQKEIRSLLR